MKRLLIVILFLSLLIPGYGQIGNGIRVGKRKANSAVKVTPSTASLTWNQDTATFSVNKPGFTLSASANWIHTSTTGNSVTVVVDSSFIGTARTGYVVASLSNKKDTFKISQDRGYIREAAKLIARITDWGTLTSEKVLYRKSVIDSVFRMLKRDTILETLDDLKIYANCSEQAALLNWVKNAHNSTNVGSVSFTPDGYFQGSGSNYLNENYNPATDAVHLSINSIHVSIWRVTTQNSGYEFGSVAGGKHFSYGQGTQGYIGSGGVAPVAVTNSVGLKTMLRTSSSTQKSYNNGVFNNSTDDAATSFYSGNMFVFSRNLGGSPNSNVNNKISMFAIGGKLSSTQVVKFYNIMNYYMTNKDSAVLVGSNVFNVKSYGALGNGSTNDSAGIRAAIVAAEEFYTVNNTTPIVYFPAGTYETTFLQQTTPNMSNILVKGANKNTTTIESKTGMLEGYIFNTDNITIKNIYLKDQWVIKPTSVLFKDTRFITTRGRTLLTRTIWCGHDNDSSSYYFSGCSFDYDSIYIAISATNVKYLELKNNTFTGGATHPIRIDVCDSAYIADNDVYRGTTGIFIGSQRYKPSSNVYVLHNTVHGQEEEGISFDGFGNNYTEVPVIGNGVIRSVTNDGNGRLVLTTKLQYPTDNEGASDTLLISDRTDWTRFYYSFESGTGLEGRYFKILGYNAVNNTLTIDTICHSSHVTVGGIGSVDAGFFNCTVANNTVYDVAITGISIWLNCFNFSVYGNTITNCPQGINVAGGLMLNCSRTKAWRINVHNNSITNSLTFGIKFSSAYDNIVKQYDNVLKDNTFYLASFQYEDQLRFTNSNNIIRNP